MLLFITLPTLNVMYLESYEMLSVEIWNPDLLLSRTIDIESGWRTLVLSPIVWTILVQEVLVYVVLV